MTNVPLSSKSRFTNRKIPSPWPQLLHKIPPARYYSTSQRLLRWSANFVAYVFWGRTPHAPLSPRSQYTKAFGKEHTVQTHRKALAKPQSKSDPSAAPTAAPSRATVLQYRRWRKRVRHVVADPQCARMTANTATQPSRSKSNTEKNAMQDNDVLDVACDVACVGAKVPRQRPRRNEIHSRVAKNALHGRSWPCGRKWGAGRTQKGNRKEARQTLRTLSLRA